jgi:hypothetical protein
VSIVRVGLAETKHFAEGYDAIFSKKRPAAAKVSKKQPVKRAARPSKSTQKRSKMRKKS